MDLTLQDPLDFPTQQPILGCRLLKAESLQRPALMQTQALEFQHLEFQVGQNIRRPTAALAAPRKGSGHMALNSGGCSKRADWLQNRVGFARNCCNSPHRADSTQMAKNPPSYRG